MGKPRKPLKEILNQFDEEADTSTEAPIPSQSVDITEDSLIAQLAIPKNKSEKIRFTLDLEKSLDNRLKKVAKRLNRTKADVTRIALEQLLTQLEAEMNE